MANSKNTVLNYRLIAVYAGLAALLIIAFQVYWLYNTYKIEQEQMGNDVGTGLREYVLSNDARNLLSGNAKKQGMAFTSESFEKKRTGVLPEGVNVEIKMLGNDGGHLSDSLTRKMLDSVLGLSNIPRADSLAANKYLSGLKDAYPGMRFTLTAKGKVYPKVSQEEPGMEVSAASRVDPRETYTLQIYNPAIVVLRKMYGTIALSVLYLLICLSAVYLMLRNIKKNRLLMEAKDNFTQNMTHELKTPLATLSAAAEALHTYNFIENKAVAQEYLEIMMNDIKRLDAMTSAILTNARLNNNTITMLQEPVNLKGLVDEVLANFKPRMHTLDATVEVTIDPGIMLTADRMHLGNVFSNLVDNALKYSNKKPEIVIAAAGDGNTLRITIADNGIGIPPPYHKEIFNSYVRVHEGDLHNVKGFGIGLTYAREIIQRHNGTIRVLHSEKDRGTTFEIIVPYQ